MISSTSLAAFSATDANDLRARALSPAQRLAPPAAGGVGALSGLGRTTPPVAPPATGQGRGSLLDLSV